MSHVTQTSAARYFGFVGAMAAGMVRVAAADSISLLDTTFHNADWAMVVLQENFISQNFTAAQEPTGGMPDEYRRNHMQGSETTNNQGVGPAGATVGHFWTTAGWDPSLQGAVDGVMYHADAVAFDDRPPGQVVPTGVRVSMGFLLRQAGVVYVRNPVVAIAGPDGIWRPLSYNATDAASFTRFDQQPGQPDFSTTGGPIEFGYYTQAGAFFPFINNFFGIDNFEVTISTPGPIVPEPEIAALVVMGMAIAMACRRWGSRRRVTSPESGCVRSEMRLELGRWRPCCTQIVEQKAAENAER
jgi:hypothetical protein